MYSTDFICTYKLLPDEEQEDLYRIQYLQAFNVETWDNKVISDTMSELYKRVKDDSDIKDILNHVLLSNELQCYINLIGKEYENIFCLLFSFELFDLTHKCLCDIMNKSIISEINKKNLIEKL